MIPSTTTTSLMPSVSRKRPRLLQPIDISKFPSCQILQPQDPQPCESPSNSATASNRATASLRPQLFPFRTSSPFYKTQSDPVHISTGSWLQKASLDKAKLLQKRDAWEKSFTKTTPSKRGLSSCRGRTSIAVTYLGRHHPCYSKPASSPSQQQATPPHARGYSHISITHRRQSTCQSRRQLVIKPLPEAENINFELGERLSNSTDGLTTPSASQTNANDSVPMEFWKHCHNNNSVCQCCQRLLASGRISPSKTDNDRQMTDDSLSTDNAFEDFEILCDYSAGSGDESSHFDDVFSNYNDEDSKGCLSTPAEDIYASGFDTEALNPFDVFAVSDSSTTSFAENFRYCSEDPSEWCDIWTLDLREDKTLTTTKETSLALASTESMTAMFDDDSNVCADFLSIETD